MTIEDAAAMGFKAPEAERAIAVLTAMAIPGDLPAAMDLARMCRIPLDDAAMALADPRRCRRLGFDPATVRSEVAGMAVRYSGTFYGSLDVREAQGHTFTRAFTDLVESLFGKR